MSVSPVSSLSSGVFMFVSFCLSRRPVLMSVMKWMERKGKEKYLYSAILVRTHTVKALRHGSHSFTCKLHHACLSFVSVHQMAPPLTESLLLIYRPRRDERLSWPGWLIYSGWLTHISGHHQRNGLLIAFRVLAFITLWFSVITCKTNFDWLIDPRLWFMLNA